MTEFRVEVVRIIQVRKHENADNLSITDVHGGYPCIFRTGDFQEGQLAVYIPVDALVPVAKPYFKFLDTGKGREFERVKAKRLRGVFSMGLLIPAPHGAAEGDDLRSALGVEKWEPPAEREPQQPNRPRKRGSWLAYVWLRIRRLLGLGPPAAPKVPVYDIEGLRKFSSLLLEGEQVVITEKIHGCNARYLHTGKRFYVGSRTQFRGSGPSVWHTAAERYDLEKKLAQYPGMVLFGEVYGRVQDLKYGVPASEEVRFAAFDVLWRNKDGTTKYLDTDNARSLCATMNIPFVPELYRGPWKNELRSLAEGKTTMPGADHVREGFVVKPVTERIHPKLGRVILKLAGEGYLTRKEA